MTGLTRETASSATVVGSQPATRDKRKPPIPQPVEPLAYTIDAAIRATGISRSSVYNLLAAGRLKSVKVGKRRLILRDSLTALVAGEAA